jgi:hypothetical protein
MGFLKNYYTVTLSSLFAIVASTSGCVWMSNHPHKLATINDEDSYQAGSIFVPVSSVDVSQSVQYPATKREKVANGVEFETGLFALDSTANREHTCFGNIIRNQPPAWEPFNQRLSAIGGRTRIGVQNGEDFYFMDLIGGRTRYFFNQSPEYCSFQIGIIRHDFFQPSDEIMRLYREENYSMNILETKIYNGGISPEERRVLFDGDLTVSTNRWPQNSGFCPLLIQFGQNTPLFLYNPSHASRIFYLRGPHNTNTADETIVYKFDLTQMPAKGWNGECFLEITQIQLPPIFPAASIRAESGAPNAASPVARTEVATPPPSSAQNGAQGNMRVNFSSNLREEIPDNQRAQRVNVVSGTSHSVSFHVEESQQISLQTGNSLDVSVFSFVQAEWNRTVGRGISTSTGFSRTVTFDGSLCSQWEYDVVQKVRDGTITLQGQMAPVPIRVIEGVDIRVRNLC